MMMLLSQRIKSLRIKEDITQKELADSLDINPVTMSLYETGKREPSICNLSKLADHFGVSTDYLIGRTDIINGDYPFEVTDDPRKHPIEIDVYRHIKADESLSSAPIDFKMYLSVLPTEHHYHYIGFTVHCKSMYPKYQMCDIAIIRLQDHAESGDDCLVLLDGDKEAGLKTVKCVGSITTYEPINQLYNPKIFVDNKNTAKVFGIVVEIRRTVKHII